MLGMTADWIRPSCRRLLLGFTLATSVVPNRRPNANCHVHTISLLFRLFGSLVSMPHKKMEEREKEAISQNALSSELRKNGRVIFGGPSLIIPLPPVSHESDESFLYFVGVGVCF